MPPRPARIIACCLLAGTSLAVGSLAVLPDHAVVAAAAAEAGGARAFGDAPAVSSVPRSEPLTAAAPTPTGRGIVVTSSAGAVYTGGDAPYAGGLQDRPLNQPVVGVAVAPSGRGYWMAASDGGMFTFGDAAFHGSLGGTPLNQPVVGLAATPTGNGYWLVARDGGIFTFGDAAFHGSLGGTPLNQPVVGLAATPTGNGYWLVARDGGAFTFGDAAFHGSSADEAADGTDAVALVRGGTSGYWIVRGRGGVRVALAGDVHGEGRVRSLLDRGENPVSEVADHFRRADVAAVNLETPVARPGAPQPKQYVFLAPPSLLDGLARGGVDVVSLANNHAMDHGRGALLETIANVRAAGLVPVGAGRDAAEAFRPAFMNVRGRRVAVIGLSRVVPAGWAATASSAGVASAYDERASLGAVRAARAEADAVVVLVHWGTESAGCAGADVIALADRLHDAGATVVAGHHPHVLQGIRTTPHRVTAYSLGNFVWYHDQPPSNVTGVLDVTVGAASVSSDFRPARIGSDGRPRFLAGDEADVARRRIGTTCAG